MRNIEGKGGEGKVGKMRLREGSRKEIREKGGQGKRGEKDVVEEYRIDRARSVRMGETASDRTTDKL